MVVQSRSNRTPAQRLAAGGSVAIGALWTCMPRGGVSSNFALGSAAPQDRVPSQQLRHGRVAGAKGSELNPNELPTASSGAAGQAGQPASFRESLPTLGVSGALAVLSAAGLRASRQRQLHQRARTAVQRGPWRKKLAEFFGLGKDSGSSSTLRDEWQRLADQAASVASKNAAKAAPKKAATPEKAKPAAASSASAGTLRDFWQAQAERAVFVAANGPDKASSLPVAAATSAMKEEAFDVFKPETYGNITMDDVKKYGTAGTVAYVVTELIFWAVAIPTECFIFYETAGRWPDFGNDYDKAAVLGFVFAASNIARLCLPLRFGAALAMAPWVDENIINPGKETAQDGSA